mgnify:CR=1 FL=1|tara:strand:- start:318 stop:899 length:582 start_codon:yes stop_codon:yes gene_type:complete
MNKKIIIQLILFSIIIIIISLFFFQVDKRVSNTNKKTVSSISDEDFANVLENIEYFSNDEIGNEYIIKAEHGQILNENKNLILMNNVSAEINFNYSEKITILSKKAVYNTLNYDTKFEDDIIIKYGDHNILSENVDMLFKDQRIKIYNKIEYTNLNTFLLADIAEIDLLTKNLKIYMNETKKKINITYNNDAN